MLTAEVEAGKALAEIRHAESGNRARADEAPTSRALRPWMDSRAGGHRGVASTGRAGSCSPIGRRCCAQFSIGMARTSARKMSSPVPGWKARCGALSRLGSDVAEPVQVQSGQIGFAIESLKLHG
jgi:hypothetical protein